MAKVTCRKCGKGADSKCPHCRSIFGAEDTATERLDSVAGHRLVINADRIMIRVLNDDPAKILSMLVNSVNRAAVTDGVSVEEVCKVIACVHDWQFAPHAHSEIGCGHRSPVDPDFEWSKAHVQLLISMGWDPEEPCECGDKLKAHRDDLGCACCDCLIFRPTIKKEEVVP